MKVLMLSTDKKIFDSTSEVRKRMIDYGAIFEELHIVVFTKQKTTNDKQQLTTINNNIWVYPTNSKFKFFYLWDTYKITKSSIVSRQLSIISCQDSFETGLVGWLLKLRFNLPLQLQVHTDIFSPYFWQESWKNKLQVLLAKFLLPRADGIRVVSERIKQSLKAKGLKLKNEPVVLPIFVDVKKIQSAKAKFNLHQKYPEYDFIILMASRLTKEKNIGMAIEAMKELSQRSNVKSKMLLLIVGDGSEREALQKSIGKCQLSNVLIEPWTSDLVSYYKTADLFLLTSNYEGYGRTVIEAMASGLPVIMSDVGLAGELLIDDLDGRVVSAGDEKALAAAIVELKENPAKREEFKLNSLKLLEKWPAKKEYLEKYRNSLEMLK